jgi:hypothetical protein
LCRYSQHDLSASGFGAALAVLVGCHLAVVVLVVAGASSGVVCGGSVGVIAMVAIWGVIFGCFVKFCKATFTTFWAAVGKLSATYRARISTSFAATSSSSESESDGAANSSIIVTGVGAGAGFEFWPCKLINNFAHFVVPSTSSMHFSLLLVVVI